MNAPDFNGEPGSCWWDKDREDHGQRDPRDSCPHPQHWRADDGGCRLCEASAVTLETQRQRRARLIR